MTITASPKYKNAQLDELNSYFGSGLFDFRSGSKPATANLAATGTLLGQITLPATPFAAASGGAIAKNGTWSDPAANADGTIGHCRMKESGDDDSLNGAFHRLDFTCTATGGGGDVTVQNTSVATGQTITITSVNLTL